MEIKVRCSRCLSELDAEVVDNEILVDICEECFSDTYSEAFEEGKKEGKE